MKLVTLATLLLLATGCGPAVTSIDGDREKTPREEAEFQHKLATGFLYEKKPIAALRELHNGLQKDPTHAESHYLTGFIYMGRHNYSEAVVHLRKALELKPKLYEAHNALAASYMALQRWQDALEASEPLLDDPLNPAPWLAHNNAGWSHFELGQRSRAVHHLKTAIFLNSKFCLGYYNLGVILKRGGQIDQARLHLEQARRQCPKHPSTLFELGEVYEHLRRPADAKEAYKSCHELVEGSVLGERCRRREARLR